MTRDETVSLIRSITSLYPNWKPDNLTDTVNAWHWALEEYPAEGIKAALQIFVKTNKTGFAPSVSQLIDAMHSPQTNNRLTEGEAWSLVKDAISDGNYHARERFEALPPEVQQAIGGAEVIRGWAQTDTEEVNTVIMSNFQRAYRCVLERAEYESKVPPQLSDFIKQLSDKVAPKQIERGVIE